MDSIPRDPYMLLSFVNMKLRDQYDSLDAMCEDLDIAPADIELPLNEAGFFYDAENNRFS